MRKIDENVIARQDGNKTAKNKQKQTNNSNNKKREENEIKENWEKNNVYPASPFSRLMSQCSYASAILASPHLYYHC